MAQPRTILTLRGDGVSGPDLAARATVLALGATWLATWSWSGLTEADSRFLFPLLVIAGVVGVIGLVGRRFG